LGITSLRACIIAASLLSVCAVSHAAGLGKLNVLSALGEPLKAEVELVAEKNEIGSLSARLATREAFERAGLAYTPLLNSVKVSVEKRANGEPYVMITSGQPANEPFVDLLIELTWASGRISREFTALLDPPAVIAAREKQSATPEVKAVPATPQPKAEPVPPPTAEAARPEAPNTEAPKAEAPKTEAPKTEAPKTEEPSEAPKTGEPAAQPAPVPAAPVEAKPEPTAPVETIGGSQPTLLGEAGTVPSSTPSADAYGPVRSGDTLNKIATATKPAGVSLEQMLVLLVRNNPEAFSAKNMNRLKTGKILQLPAAEDLATISEADARKEVRIQARDWRAYRDQLASSAGQGGTQEQPATQSASGKIGSTVQDQSAPGEPPKEVLKLSKNEPAAGAGAGGDARSAARVRALEEEVVARDKAVKEANDRVAKLEKQITDLKSLLELKSRGMADPQKPATPPAVASSKAPAAPPAQQSTPSTPAPEARPTTAAPSAPMPASPPPQSDSAPASPPPAPVQPKPAAVKPPSVPAPEPSLMDQILEQPAYLGAAIGVLIIIGALAVRAVKRRRESKTDSEESGPARVAEGADPAYTAGAVAAGEAHANAQTDASSEVDPVAEAEIFLAYGRDAQAEELLKEALERAPGREEIYLKLLQIYAGRRDAKSFEKVARDLQQASGGTGEIWDQALALGYQVDPANPRYAAGKSSAAFAAAGAGAASAIAENVDFNIGTDDATAVTATDIDLGEGASAFERTQVIDSAGAPALDDTVSFERAEAPAMAFNVDSPSAGTSPAHAPAASASGLDFEIDLNAISGATVSDKNLPPEPAAGGLDFDMSGLSLETPSEPRLEKAAPEIDLSGISLDLGTETAPGSSPSGKDDHWYDVQTKFDLAKAYQEMGDKDGAREILKEVLAEGDTDQKTAAQSVLSSLDS